MTSIVEELETYPFVLDREAIIKGMGRLAGDWPNPRSMWR